MRTTKPSQIKLNKDSNGTFYNVSSSYHHLIENLSNELKLREGANKVSAQKTNYAPPKNPNLNSNFGKQNHSFNFTKKQSFSKGKSIVASSFDLNEKPQYYNQRLNTDTLNYSVNKNNHKQRDMSPVLYDSFKQLTKTKNNPNKTSNNFSTNSLYFYLKNIKKKPTSLGKKITNISGNSNYEVCLTEPEEKKNRNEKSTTNYYSNGYSNAHNPSHKSKFEYILSKNKKTKSPEVNHNHAENKITSMTGLFTKKIGHTVVTKIKPNLSNSKAKKPVLNNYIKPPTQIKEKSTNQYNTYKDLNININTNININSPLLSTGNNSSEENHHNMVPVENGNNNHIEPEIISINSIFNNKEISIQLSNLQEPFQGYENAKYSTKPIGNIRAYAANTYQGIIRNYNEDRVSIILNIAKPPNHKGTWPKCSLFGIYDGHGGNTCADFLRDKLHSFIIKDHNFPSNPQQALIKGFEKAEEYFINNYAIKKEGFNYQLMDKSGSCAIVALIVENICYVANVGDSRGLISMNNGKDIRVLTTDHKPNEEHESFRIISKGGKIYQTQTPTKLFNPVTGVSEKGAPSQILLGPYRVFPGRLSVSRTIGDAEAKLPQLGGIEGVVIAKPEITYFCIEDEIDFLMLGCDGIFDQLTNEEVADCVWMTTEGGCDVRNIHEQCMVGADMIMKSSLMRKTLDNITVVLVAFKNFENEVNKKLGMNGGYDNNESFQEERLATEPTYNFQHEKIKMKTGMRNKELQTNLSNGVDFGHERKLSPPSSTKNVLSNKKKAKKVYDYQNRLQLSPKFTNIPKFSYFSKK